MFTASQYHHPGKGPPITKAKRSSTRDTSGSSIVTAKKSFVFYSARILFIGALALISSTSIAYAVGDTATVGLETGGYVPQNAGELAEVSLLASSYCIVCTS